MFIALRVVNTTNRLVPSRSKKMLDPWKTKTNVDKKNKEPFCHARCAMANRFTLSRYLKNCTDWFFSEIETQSFSEGLIQNVDVWFKKDIVTSCKVKDP
ncbi:hypothetical protein M9H77_33485 [Catharanthus roseus]|uniref:Uncharacterized protein n=1 Tax=Catharanthus roseus TaxID=4058 RepID=A0ACB9ZIU9_CATRO|nr:hypothetical protein M9H77_33485 [Catharanthus roseus]